MHKPIFVVFSLALLVSLASCDNFQLFTQKDKDYRAKLEGYYKSQQTVTRHSIFPEYPSGVLSTEEKEIRVERDSDSDSAVLIDGVSYKVNSDYSYYKAEGVGTTAQYNFTDILFFSRDKKDSLEYLRVEGNESLYQETRMLGGYDRKLD